MASGYTSNYGLCQWQRSDKFLREEFNQDNEKLDAALKAAEDRATAETGRVRTRLEAINYNLCNLLLQNDYEGKYTGFKRAMLFDGFLDGDGISALSGFISGENTLSLSRTGQTNVTIATSTGSTSPLSTPELTMTGSGKITGFLYHAYTSLKLSGTCSIGYTLTINGEAVKSGTTSIQAPSQDVLTDYTLSLGSVLVKSGDVCVLRLESKTSGLVFKKGSGDTLSGTMQIQSAAASSGTMTAKAVTLPETAGVMAWVRCKGGTVGLSIKNDGQTIPFIKGETISTVEPLAKTACQETTFTLDQALEAGSWQVVLTGTIDDEETDMDVFDYGVILC